MAERLVITNGDAAVERLRESGVEATFLPWRDSLHEGPVPGGLLLEALSLIRAQFLAKDLGRSLTKLSREFSERDTTLRNHAQWPRIELWFEHDLYDQLQLIRCLSFLPARTARKNSSWCRRTIISAPCPRRRCAGSAASSARSTRRRSTLPSAPGRPSPAQRRRSSRPSRWPRRRRCRTWCWRRRRFLRELPAVTSGLSTTEERILSLLTQGEQSVGDLFRGTQVREQARFMSDLWFFRRMDGLAFARHPLIAGLPFPSLRCAEGQDLPRLPHLCGGARGPTERGRHVLAGRFDHATENAIDRWFGGTHVTPKTMWRRDQNGQLATAPGK